MKRLSLAFVLFFAVAVGAALLFAPRHASAGPGDGGPTVVGVFGAAEVNGQQVGVHILAVVPPGRSEASVKAEVLRENNARGIGSANFTTTGLVWDATKTPGGNHYLVQRYNGTKDPTGGSGLNDLKATESTWSGAGGAKFQIDFDATTGRACPSLVRGCSGRQYFDGKNDVAWTKLSGCCTLAVTWFGTTIDEADMALNTNFSWAGGCSDVTGKYSAQTVILHENGHVSGLGHSADTSAVMYAYYHGALCTLTTDDSNGLKSIYP